jgi:hypothetical protein
MPLTGPLFVILRSTPFPEIRSREDKNKEGAEAPSL